GELGDLFSDIGEVVDSFVNPPTNGHTYTYGFVRFYTLEEAKDAVKEKNTKVIGSRHINVELSSSTRRNLQTNTDEEGIGIYR
ncbi:RNA-processing, HAT helix, partial [Paramuricea clavata]